MFETDPKIVAQRLRVIIDEAENEAELEKTVGQLLCYASDIVEGAAFELARLDVPRNVTELILIAGRLDCLAHALSDDEAAETPSA